MSLAEIVNRIEVLIRAILGQIMGNYQLVSDKFSGKHSDLTEKGVLTHPQIDAAIEDLQDRTDSFIYVDTVPIPERIGGFEKDSTIPEPGKTQKEMWDNLRHPYQIPNILSLSISQNPLLVEVGTVISSNTQFSWTKNNEDNLKDGGILKQSGVSIDAEVDLKGVANKVVNIAVDGSTPKIVPFQLFGIDTQNNPVNSPIVNLQFVHPVFHGFVTQPNKPLASELSITTNKRVVISTVDVTFALNTGDMDYTWIAIPQSTQFTKWYENVENAGLIGDTGLFATGIAINLTSAQWANVPYWVYITNYRSACRTFIFQR